MAFTFDSTSGGVSANSYVSTSEADDYFTGHLEGEQWWEPLSSGRKQAALVQSSLRLEQEAFGGLKDTDTQALSWPRQMVYDREGCDYRDRTVIPPELKIAVYELALYYLKKVSGEFTSDDEDLETLDSYKVGPLDMVFKKGMKADRLPTKVVRQLQSIGPNGWLGGSINTIVR